MANNIKGITIELGASTTGLSKALESVNKQSVNIAKELKKVENGLKFSPKSTELLSQKQKLLGNQVATTKEKLEKLKSAQDQVKKQYEAGEIDEGKYRAFQRELVETESKLEHYEEQLKKVNKENNNFEQKIEKTTDKLNKVGKKLQSVGEGMSKKVTAPIVAAGAASMVAWKEVDGALDTITTKTGATGEAMEGFSDSFRNVGKNLPVELQAVGDAIGEVNTQFGLTDEALEKASEQIIKFSEINGQDVTASTIASKGAIEAFGLSANDLSAVLDSVTKTAQNTGVGTDKLFDSVTKGAPQLKALKLNFSQATEMMGRFEQKGLDSSKALSYMSKAQVTFAKEGKTLGKGLGELVSKIQNSKSETEQLTLASEYFGTKGATFMLDAIKRGALDFKDFEGAATSAAGSVTETFEGTLDPADKFKTAMNNLKLVGSDIATSLQNTLAPMLSRLVEKLQKFSDWWQNLSPQTQETIIRIALVAAAIGPLLVGIGKVATGVSAVIDVGKKLKNGFGIVAGILSPGAPIIIGIAAVIAIGILLYKNWDKIKAKAHELSESIKQKWEDIKTATGEKWEAIKQLPGKKLAEAKEAISNKMQNIKDTIHEKVEGIKEKFRNMFNVSIKMPHIPMPHFKKEGKFSINPPSLPSFNFEGWYDKGGIFNSASIIGVGEKRPEFVGALDDLRYLIRDELKKVSVGGTKPQTIIVPVNLDGHMIAKVEVPYIDKLQGNNIKIAGRRVGL